MTRDAKRQLERLSDDLADLIELSSPHCGLGLFVLREPVGVLIPPSGWAFLDERLDEARRARGSIRMEPDPWLDPFPDGTACIRWWGAADEAKAFQKWTVRASAFFRSYVPLPAGIAMPPGYHGAIRTFIQLAKTNASLFPRLETRTILDVKALSPAKRRLLPPIVQSIVPPPVFTYDDGFHREKVAQLTLRILTDEATRPPRLEVDVEAGTITIDGKTHREDEVWVHILHLLISANGRPILRREMRKDPVLEPYDSLNLQIKRMEKKLGINIESSNKGYWLPEEYL